jgi:hypothetical protein
MKKNEDWIEKITKYKLWFEVKLKKNQNFNERVRERNHK